MSNWSVVTGLADVSNCNVASGATLIQLFYVQQAHDANQSKQNTPANKEAETKQTLQLFVSSTIASSKLSWPTTDATARIAPHKEAGA